MKNRYDDIADNNKTTPKHSEQLVERTRIRFR